MGRYADATEGTAMLVGLSPAIRSDFPPATFGPMPEMSRGPRAEATGYSYDAQQSAALTIVTAEGDRVTISASHSLSIDAATYDSRGRMRGAEGSFYERTESSSMSIQVEGNLSEEELEDIARVVRELAKVGRAFERGHQAHAMRRLARADLDTLASIEAEFSATRQIEVARLAVAPPPVPAPQPSVMPELLNTTVATAE
jgi:hypothetical protein